MGCCGHIINDIIPYVNNAMLAAILSLLIVILFVLLLHVYARWFLGRANTRRAMDHALGPPRRGLAQSTTYTYDIMTSSSMCPTISKGLDRTAVDAIPMFVYEIRSSSSTSTTEGQDSGKNKGEEWTVEIEEVLECAICLSVFEEKEIGRSLPRCSHAFHVDCIDMWLLSHSTCPVCRAHVVIDVHHHHPTAEIHQDCDHDRGETLVQIVVDQNHDHANNVGSVSRLY